MDRELTENEEITLNNLKLLGWEVFHSSYTQMFSNGTNSPYPKGTWSPSKPDCYMTHQYPILRLRSAKRLVYNPQSDEKRGIWSHEFHFVYDYAYLLPNGQIVTSWDEACDIVANQLDLGFIEGSEIGRASGRERV